MSRANKASGFLSLLFGLAAFGGVGWWMTRAAPPPPPDPERPPYVVPVTVVPIAMGDVTEQVELVGDVLAPERSRLAFERAGRIRELSIELGDVVKSGGVIARLDDTLIEQEEKAAAAALAQAKEDATLAAREAERAHRMKDVDMSEAALDRADTLVRSTAAHVDAFAAALEVVKARRQQGVLVAPFDAMVMQRPVAQGSYVAAGDECCELLSLERRDVLLEIPPAVAAHVREGAPVALRSDVLPGFTLAASLFAVLPSEQARARTFTGVVRLAASDDPERRLKPGLFIRATVELRAAKNATVVPVDALLTNERGTSLAIVATGEKPTAALVPIEVLARDADHAAIRPVGDAKLDDATKVILTGKENVFPGANVLPTLLQAAGAK